ncbi:MAG: hypothetical protein II413_11325, partial [Treponema sp.]|nr:hypothetical protein [Treponema sp.]
NLVWKEFMQSVQVPSINSNPLAEEFVGDFFRDAGKLPVSLAKLPVRLAEMRTAKAAIRTAKAASLPKAANLPKAASRLPKEASLERQKQRSWTVKTQAATGTQALLPAKMALHTLRAKHLRSTFPPLEKTVPLKSQRSFLPTKGLHPFRFRRTGHFLR